jgi:hypothetical protein
MTGKYKTKNRKAETQAKQTNTKPKKTHNPRPYKNGVKKNSETERPQNLCRDLQNRP